MTPTDELDKLIDELQAAIVVWCESPPQFRQPITDIAATRAALVAHVSATALTEKEAAYLGLFALPSRLRSQLIDRLAGRASNEGARDAAACQFQVNGRLEPIVQNSETPYMTRVGYDPTTYGLKVPQIVRHTRPHRVQHGSAHHTFRAKLPPNRCRYSSVSRHQTESRTKMVSE